VLFTKNLLNSKKGTPTRTPLTSLAIPHTIDFREIHDVFREQGKYISKIEKENQVVAEYLKKLEDLIDKVWHGLQDEYQVNFDQTRHDKWMDAIIKFRNKDKLCGYIRENSKEILNHFAKKGYGKVIEYLQKQIPS
jgi:hypothetical protein